MEEVQFLIGANDKKVKCTFYVGEYEINDVSRLESVFSAHRFASLDAASATLCLTSTFASIESAANIFTRFSNRKHGNRYSPNATL